MAHSVRSTLYVVHYTELSPLRTEDAALSTFRTSLVVFSTSYGVRGARIKNSVSRCATRRLIRQYLERANVSAGMAARVRVHRRVRRCEPVAETNPRACDAERWSREAEAAGVRAGTRARIQARALAKASPILKSHSGPGGEAVRRPGR